jgi:hypothetical protein
MEISALKDLRGNPLVIGKQYLIKLKPTEEEPIEREQQMFGHNQIGTLESFGEVEDDTPTGTFQLENGDKVTVNNFICTFTPCSSGTCSISGGKRRSRRKRSRRSRRSRRFA